MRDLPFIAALIALSCGCQTAQIQRLSLNQADIVRDLQYQQVLDNLAMFQENPAAVPFCSLINNGVAQSDSLAQTNVPLTWNPFTLVSEAFMPMLQHKTSDSWTLEPVNSPYKLNAMRCVYQQATGFAPLTNQCPGCIDLLKDKQAPCACNQMLIPPPGWYAVGKKHQVPHAAHYVGHHCDTYVWVLPGGEDSLARLAITIFDIALATPKATKGSVTLASDVYNSINESVDRTMEQVNRTMERADGSNAKTLQDQVDALRNDVNDLEKLRQSQPSVLLLPSTSEQQINPADSMIPAFRPFNSNLLP
ncbi:MAG TPA: hypothetical protein VFE46_15375 [Pirellulales bacterium]|jgi:hypothetical protein|nr:hypothetical protein [Pirellulales bacterium]